MVPHFRWLLWLRNEIVYPSYISGDYGLNEIVHLLLQTVLGVDWPSACVPVWFLTVCVCAGIHFLIVKMYFLHSFYTTNIYIQYLSKFFHSNAPTHVSTVVTKNTDPICLILLTRLTLLYTFLCQTSVVLITASTKAAMAITYSK